METDPVLSEIRAIREVQISRHGFQIHEFVKEAQRKDAVGDRLVVQLPPPRPIVSASKSN